MGAGVSGARLGREPQEGLHTDLPLTVAGASGGSDVGGPLAWARLGQGAGRGGFGGLGAAAGTTVRPGSWSGGWRWGCNRQISCLCVFATPFYKGKHNLKYDYLVL